MQASSLGWYLHEQPAPLLKTEQIKRIPVTTRGTHTHTRLPDRRRKAKVRANAHVRTHMRHKNEDMTGGRDGTKVRVVEMTGEPSAQGSPPHCKDLGDLKPVFNGM